MLELRPESKAGRRNPANKVRPPLAASHSRNGPSYWKESWGRLLPVRGFWEARIGSAKLTLLAGGSSYGRTYYLVLERHALGVVFVQPSFRGVRSGKHLDVLGVFDLLAGVA